MGSKDELKEIDINNGACYYFDDIIKNTDINFSNSLLDEKYMKIFQFMKLYTKLQWVQNHCLSGSMK